MLGEDFRLGFVMASANISRAALTSVELLRAVSPYRHVTDDKVAIR